MMLFLALALAVSAIGALVSETCTTSGNVSTIALQGFSPTGLAVHPLTGQLLFSDGNLNILGSLALPNITLLAGNGSAAFADGPLHAARFDTPWGLAFLGESGAVAVCDAGNHRVRLINTSSQIATTLAGSGAPGWADGDGAGARFNFPTGIAYFAQGLYVADTLNHCIRLVSTATLGQVSTLAGSRLRSYADGLAAAAGFSSPLGIAIDRRGAVYLADTGNHAVRKLVRGNVTTLTGSPYLSLFWDSSPACCSTLYRNLSASNTCCAANFYSPSALVVDWWGNVIVTDTGNRAVRFVSSSGFTTTLAAGKVSGGNNSAGWFPTASLIEPLGIILDNASNALVSDGGGNALHLLSFTHSCRSLSRSVSNTDKRLPESFRLSIALLDFGNDMYLKAGVGLFVTWVLVSTCFFFYNRPAEIRGLTPRSCAFHSSGLLVAGAACCVLPYLYGKNAGGPAAASAMLALNLFFLTGNVLEQKVVGGWLSKELFRSVAYAWKNVPSAVSSDNAALCMHFEGNTKASPVFSSFSAALLLVSGARLAVVPHSGGAAKSTQDLDLTQFRVQLLTSCRPPLAHSVLVSCLLAVAPTFFQGLVLLLMSSAAFPYPTWLVALFGMAVFPYPLWAPFYCLYCTSRRCLARCAASAKISPVYASPNFPQPAAPQTRFLVLLKQNVSVVLVHAVLLIPLACIPPGERWLDPIAFAATALLFFACALRLVFENTTVSTLDRGFALVPKRDVTALTTHFFLARDVSSRDFFVKELAHLSVNRVPGISTGFLTRLLDALQSDNSSRAWLTSLLVNGGWTGNDGPIEGRIDWSRFAGPLPFSTGDLCYEFIKPATFHSKRSFYATYQPGFASFTGPATAFLSHSWGSKFSALVEGVCYTEKHLDEVAGTDALYLKYPPVLSQRLRYFWVDIVFKNQHEAAGGTTSTISTAEYSAKTKREFEDNLCPLAETWVVSTASANGSLSAGTDAFTRAWCLFEINLTVARAGFQTLFLTIPPTVDTFVQSISVPVQLENAKAFKPADLAMIRHSVIIDGGFLALDKNVEKSRGLAAKRILENQSKAIHSASQSLLFNSSVPHLVFASALAFLLGAIESVRCMVFVPLFASSTSQTTLHPPTPITLPSI